MNDKLKLITKEIKEIINIFESLKNNSSKQKIEECEKNQKKWENISKKIIKFDLNSKEFKQVVNGYLFNIYGMGGYFDMFFNHEIFSNQDELLIQIHTDKIDDIMEELYPKRFL